MPTLFSGLRRNMAGRPLKQQAQRRHILCVVIGCLAVGSACSDSRSTGTRATAAATDGPSVALLDQTLVAYGNCLAEHFIVSLQYRIDPFSGMHMSLKPLNGGTVSAADAAQGDKWMEDCGDRTNVDEVASTFIQTHPLSDRQNQALAEDFRACAGPLLSPSHSDRLQDVKNRDDIYIFQSDLSKSDPASVSGVQSCLDTTLYGPIKEFTSSGS